MHGKSSRLIPPSEEDPDAAMTTDESSDEEEIEEAGNESGNEEEGVAGEDSKTKVNWKDRKQIDKKIIEIFILIENDRYYMGYILNSVIIERKIIDEIQVHKNLIKKYRNCEPILLKYFIYFLIMYIVYIVQICRSLCFFLWVNIDQTSYIY